MTLRDCMLYHGIRTSRRFAELSWFHRDFFYGLLNVAWPAGRFEADVGLLRAALYGPLLSRVSKRDVQEALVECHRLGLVKLWTGDDGRGWGEVVNYRQHGLKKRQQKPDAEPAADADPPDPGLFTGVLPLQKEGKKEGRGSARGALNPPAHPICIHETEEEWIARLSREWPRVDIRGQLALAQANRRRSGRALERDWFVDHWLPRCSPEVGSPRAAETDDGPPGWQAWVAEQYPASRSVSRFTLLPQSVRIEVRKALGR